jgi:uncharacterized protein with PQ loop repeat
MLFIFQLLFNLIIIISPIFSYFPQIIKVIKMKSDAGFNTMRVTLSYLSVFSEMLLNLSFNQTNIILYKNNLDFLNHNARLISLFLDLLGIIFKILIKTKYSNNKKIQKKYNKFLVIFTVFNLGLFLPFILCFNLYWLNTFFSIISSFLNMITFIPQIYETYKIKKSGSLSYISTGLEYIGSSGIILYLTTKKTIYASTLLPVLISNINILILLSLMIYYDYGDYIKLKLNKYKKLNTYKNSNDEVFEEFELDIV